MEVEAPQDKTVEVTLQPGWNFFSLPVIPANAAITSVLSNFSTNFEQVSRYGADGSFQHYVGNSQFDDFTQFEYGVGYEVYCKAASPVTVSLTGKLPTQGLSESLTTGWSLLPAIKLEATGVNGVFGELTYDQVLGFAAGSLSAANQVQPSSAYFLHLTQAGTFAPSLPADIETQFVYDGDGGRVKQIASDGTTRFLGQSYELAPDGKTIRYVFAGSQRIAAIDTPPGQQASLPNQSWLVALADWVFGPSAEAAVLASNIRFYHTDHLGSSNVITNGSGQVVELSENTPFGSLSRHEGSVNVPQKFTGQRSDESTGLYFYNARYYDPDLGRFIQPDPFVQSPADPQTLNRYAYVRNNPVSLVDPTGYFWKKFFSIVAIVAAVVTLGASLVAGAAGFIAAGSFGTAEVIAGAIASVASTVANVASVISFGAVIASGLMPGTGSAFSQLGDMSQSAYASDTNDQSTVTDFSLTRELGNLMTLQQSVPQREALAKQYRQDLELIRALSLNANDQITVRVGSRAVADQDGNPGNFQPFRHRYIQVNKKFWEMGPFGPERMIGTSNSAEGFGWPTAITTARAVGSGVTQEANVTVSASGLVLSMALYEAYWGTHPYMASSFNSNFAVNSVIYGAGGEPPSGLGITPGFPDN